MPDDGRTPRYAADPELIARYEQIAAASHEMVAAARHGDWDSVSRLEDSCRFLIARIREDGVQARLSTAQQRRRIALLRAILADDAEIRERSEPWLQQLEQMLRSSGGTARRSAGD
jgi:flagellar protein FliT